MFQYWILSSREEQVAVFLLPLFHLDNLVSVQSSHLQLSVEVADGESDEVLVSDPTLQYTCSDVMIEERPHVCEMIYKEINVT